MYAGTQSTPNEKETTPLNRRSVAQMNRMIKRKDFYVHLSAKAAEKLLANSLVGTYLLRFSASQPGNFAISVVEAPKKISHIVIQRSRYACRASLGHPECEWLTCDVLGRESSDEQYSVLERGSDKMTLLVTRSFRSLEALLQNYRHLLRIPFSSAVFGDR